MDASGLARTCMRNKEEAEKRGRGIVGGERKEASKDGGVESRGQCKRNARAMHGQCTGAA